ncbi:MAG TPA: Calx-beta domain-containing protein, partial [Candidatus Sulfotelmatobacter sp.]|nr:Calx-beta domain-containing protein [Candidatus Sulfotelmatobacter sp.]
IGDRLNEGNETFEIQLTNLVHLSLGQDLGMLVATITDDDPLPVVSVGDVRVLESDTGTQAVFTVSLSAASGRTTSVRCATADGTATAPSDYLAGNTLLTFAPGIITQLVTVLIVGNTVYEPDEFFYLRLSSPNSLTLGDAEGVGWIVDDDAVPGRLDHFVWNPVPSPQLVGVSFPATVIAVDAFSNVVTSFNGTVPLSAHSPGGLNLPVTPGVLSIFVAGVWTGEMTLSETNSAVVLRADDGQGHFGESAAFAVVPLPVLSVQLPSEATEGQGTASGLVSVATELARTEDLQPNVSISNTNRVTASSVLVIPAGTTNAVLSLNIIDDSLLNGSSPVTVTLSGSNCVPATGTLMIHDNETTTLNLVVPASVMENAGVITGQFQSAQAPAVDVSIALNSSNTNQIQVPSALVLAAGATQVALPITVIDNRMIDGPKQVTLTAEVRNWTAGTASLQVLDDEAPNLVLELPGTVVEGQGVLAGAGRVSLGGTLPNALTVTLSSSDTTELTLPTSVVIPTGATSSVFNVTVPEDSLRDGTQSALVTAQAPGLGSATCTIQVLDNDPASMSIGPISSPQTSGVPFQVRIRLFDVNGQPATGFQTNVGLGAWGAGVYLPVSPAVAGPFQNGEWTGMVTVTGIQQQVQLMVHVAADYNDMSAPFLLKAPLVQVLDIPRVRDLVYNPYNGKLYVSIKGNYAFISSISTLDPDTGWLQHWKDPYFYPDRIALSPDGQMLYTTFPWDIGYGSFRMSDGFECVQSFGSSWLGSFRVEWQQDDFEVLAQPNLVVASRSVYYDGGGWVVYGSAGAAVYRGGYALPDIYWPPVSGGMRLTASPDGQSVYCTWPGGYAQLAVTTNGLTPVLALTNTPTCPAFASGYGGELVFDRGLLYRQNGEVIDANRLELVACFPTNVLVRPESAINRVFLLAQDGPAGTWRLHAYDQTTYALLGVTNLTQVSGTPSRLVRAGTNALAFCTSGEQIFLLHGILQPSEPETDLAVSLQLLSGAVTLSNTTAFSLSVTNQGTNPANGLLLSARLPAALGPIAVSSADGPCWTTNATVVCTLPLLAPGASASVEFQVPTYVGGTFTCAASAASRASEANYTNNAGYLTFVVPLASDPTPRLTLFNRSSTNLVLRFPSLGGARYRLERSTTLNPGSWTATQDFIYGTGETLELSDPQTPDDPASFYRLVWLP